MPNEIIKFNQLKKVTAALWGATQKAVGGMLFKREVKGEKQVLEVQYYQSNDEARMEVMLSKLYRLAGANVPEAHLIDLGGGFYAVGKIMNHGVIPVFSPGNHIVDQISIRNDMKQRQGYQGLKDKFEAQAIFFGNNDELDKMDDKEVYIYQNENDENLYELNMIPRRFGSIKLDNEDLTAWKNKIIVTLDGANKGSAIADNMFLKIDGIIKIVFEYGPKNMQERFDILYKLVERTRYYKYNAAVIDKDFFMKLSFLNVVINNYNDNFSIINGQDRNGNNKIKIILGIEGQNYDAKKAAEFVTLLADYGIKSIKNKHSNGECKEKTIHKGQSNCEEDINLRYVVIEQSQLQTLFTHILKNQEEYEHRDRYSPSYLWFFISKMTTFITNTISQFAEVCVSFPSSAYKFVCSFNISQNAKNTAGQDSGRGYNGGEYNGGVGRG